MPKLFQKQQDSSMFSCNSLVPRNLKLGTADAFFSKTEAMLQYLVEKVPPQTDTCDTREIDKLFHTLKNLPSKSICRQVLDKMVAKKDFVFPNDSYHADFTWLEDPHRNQL